MLYAVGAAVAVADDADADSAVGLGYMVDSLNVSSEDIQSNIHWLPDITASTVTRISACDTILPIPNLAKNANLLL